MTPDWVHEPTNEQCSGHEKVYESVNEIAYAIWYPQMGGYVSHAIVVIQQDSLGFNDCFEAYVWHDGVFPFNDEYGADSEPAHLHHCTANQFIVFGETVEELLGLHRKANA